MVDNRYATALVIGSVLSLLATVYLSVAVGTQNWFQYSSPLIKQCINTTVIKNEFLTGEFDEKTYSSHLFTWNGTLGLWWRCIQVPHCTHWYCCQQDPKTETLCVSFTLPQQFSTKVKQNTSEEDLLRTYLWRCQFLLPLVSLSLVFLSGLVGVCACLCRSFTPTLVVGLFHFIAGLCSLGTVCCFRSSVHLLNSEYQKPRNAVELVGWSLYLALISFPLQMMAAALFLWAARSHRKHYTRITAYRVA
ncbi:claudin domain-containing protein 1-like isoform X2 [Xiphophorus hellerii]|uniref:claudin domain-containing protein 1-like isoform X2 n=1 Tax=Xiphophorus hellerii TaxID=8084 RepID=UPI0013B3CBC4|nr:claudin domain-containing protein 1-like isoform X2 [Xiphophorus hellerii]